jgi:hypothetical protein
MTASSNENYFKHLEKVDQTYFEHLVDSMSYCGRALQSAFYFACHGIYPDIFETNGSESILELSNEIMEKYRRLEEKRLETLDSEETIMETLI